MGFLIGLMIGVIASNFLLVLVSAVERQRLEERANAARSPGETVECYNATVFMDVDGRLGWLENDGDIPVVKRERIRTY